MNKTLFFWCIRHPQTKVELHIPGTAYCVRCGKSLRCAEAPATALSPLLGFKPTTQDLY